MWLEIPVDLDTEAANHHLLKELDRWIELGLLSAGQGLSIGRQLSSPLPIAPEAPAALAESTTAAESKAARFFETPIAARTPLLSRFKSRLVQSLLDEVSVLWLLFLGVFLVIVSSAVLAASQWQSFSTVGQYAILLVYTLAFAGASRWAARQEKLQTTAQMLEAATLLLIPLNMWMMDALGVLRASMALAAVASIGLSGLTLALVSRRRTALNLLGLSWLHWGWGLAIWPVVATYLGTVGSATNLLLPSGAEADDDSGPQSGGVLVAIALLILLLRSLWVAQVPFSQLGLAFGICGWMLCRLRQRLLWTQLGVGLMLIGWLVSAGPQPFQAIGVSGLAAWLLLERLQQQPPIENPLRMLTTLWLIGLQSCGLGWLLLPEAAQQALLIAMDPLSPQPVGAINFAGVWLHGYVGLMLIGAHRFRRRGYDAWACLTEQLSLGISGVLVVLALPLMPSFLFTLSLLGLTLALGFITYLRRSVKPQLIYGTHGAAVATLLSSIAVISTQFEGWGEPQWAMVLIVLTAVEWFASAVSHRYPEWRRSAWYLGIGLSVIAFSLLLNNWGSWLNLVWLLIPIVLTGVVFQPANERPQQATLLAVTALGTQLLLLSSWQMATVAFGVGAGLLFLHSCRWSTQRVLPVLTVGAAVAGGHSAWLWLMPQNWPHDAGRFCLVIAMFAAGLSITARVLERRSRPLLKIYGAASAGWSRGLAVLLSLGLALTLLWAYVLQSIGGGEPIRFLLTEIFVLWRYGTAAILLLLARFVGQRRLKNVGYWELAYEVGLLVMLGLSLWRQQIDLQVLASALITLAVLTQLMGTLQTTRQQCPYQTSWHGIPLAYGALGLGLGHSSFTAVTGLYSVVIGLVTLAIGRRQMNLHPLGYCGLGLLSLGIYELVIYRMLQTSGGQPGDGVTILALVGGAIALLYLLCHRWIERLSQLTAAAVKTVSYLHWLLALALMVMAMAMGHSRIGLWLWLGTASLLALYAWLRGNAHWFPPLQTAADHTEHVHDERLYQQWTWTGLIIVTVAFSYSIGQLFPNLTLIREWGALIVCGLSLIIHRLPWQRWGWPEKSWQRMALAWPILAVLLSLTMVKTQSLLLVGAFYAVMAKQLRTVRLSYLSLVLLNGALIRYLFAQGWLTLLWLGLMLGGSVLYILEVDPRWQTASARQERHALRSLAILLVGITAIYQAEIAVPFIGLSLLISFGFVICGLVTQVRAYLYIGTLTFALQILRTIMIFISTDGRMLWAIGIALGIILIWVAATFEARRAQINQLLGRWSEMLQSWE